MLLAGQEVAEGRHGGALPPPCGTSPPAGPAAGSRPLPSGSPAPRAEPAERPGHNARAPCVVLPPERSGTRADRLPRPTRQEAHQDHGHRLRPAPPLRRRRARGQPRGAQGPSGRGAVQQRRRRRDRPQRGPRAPRRRPVRRGADRPRAAEAERRVHLLLLLPRAPPQPARLRQGRPRSSARSATSRDDGPVPPTPAARPWARTRSCSPSSPACSASRTRASRRRGGARRGLGVRLPGQPRGHRPARRASPGCCAPTPTADCSATAPPSSAVLERGDEARVEVLVVAADDRTQGFTWVLGRQAAGAVRRLLDDRRRRAPPGPR